MELFGALFWILLVVIAGILAFKRGRNVFGWVALSFFLSPLLGVILLLILGSSKEKKMRQIVWEERIRKQIREGDMIQRFKINTYSAAEIRKSVKNILEKDGPFVEEPTWYVNQQTFEKIKELAQQQQFEFNNIDKDDTLPDDIVEMRFT